MRAFLLLSRLRHFSTASSSSSSSCISVSQAIARLRTEYDPDKAIAIYSSISKHQLTRSASRYAQEVTVRRLVSSGRLSEVESFLESHKKHPQITEESFLSSLIRSYGAVGMLDHSIKTYHQMDELGTPRSALSFNVLLNACIDSGNFDSAHQLFDEIPHRYKDVVPDAFSYGILLNSYCQAGFPDKALHVLAKLREKGFTVSKVMVSTLLNALYKKGNINEANMLWDDMLKNGCEFNVVVYNVRLMSMQNGKPERIRELFEEMKNVGLKPDTVSYNYLIISYFKNVMVEEAKNVFKEIKGNGLKPNAATFRNMVFYLCENEEILNAYKFFKESTKVDRIPGFDSLKHLVEGLVKQNMMKEAKEVIRIVKKKLPPKNRADWDKVQEELGLVSAEATEASKTAENSEKKPLYSIRQGGGERTSTSTSVAAKKRPLTLSTLFQHRKA